MMRLRGQCRLSLSITQTNNPDECRRLPALAQEPTGVVSEPGVGFAGHFRLFFHKAQNGLYEILLRAVDHRRVHPVGIYGLHAFGLKAEVAMPEVIGISWSPIGFPGPINVWAGCPGPNGWMHHHGDAGGIVTPARSVRPERLPTRAPLLVWLGLDLMRPSLKSRNISRLTLDMCDAGPYDAGHP